MPAPFPTVKNCVLVPTNASRRSTARPRNRARNGTHWRPDVEAALDIAQLKEGHRFSNDDAFCGFFAAEAAPDARRLLDLGSGVGSVGLITLWRSSPRSHTNVRRGPVLVARLVSTYYNKKATRLETESSNLASFSSFLIPEARGGALRSLRRPP